MAVGWVFSRAAWFVAAAGVDIAAVSASTAGSSGGAGTLGGSGVGAATTGGVARAVAGADTAVDICCTEAICATTYRNCCSVAAVVVLLALAGAAKLSFRGLP